MELEQHLMQNPLTCGNSLYSLVSASQGQSRPHFVRSPERGLGHKLREGAPRLRASATLFCTPDLCWTTNVNSYKYETHLARRELRLGC